MSLSVVTRFATQAEANATARALTAGRASVTRVQSALAEDPPPPAFSTALMLQAANAELGWTSAQTMRVAQKLFEGVTVQGRRLGLITYPRTTGTTAIARLVTEARRLVARRSGRSTLAPPQLSLFGEPALSAVEGTRHWYAPLVAAVQRGARQVMDWARRLFGRAPVTEAAHECIRPTVLTREPATLRGLVSDEILTLYTLIYTRFLDSQRRGERYRLTQIEVEYDDDAPVAKPAPVSQPNDIDEW